jgi:sugar/nucleoside kinase (ribokinase family)
MRVCVLGDLVLDVIVRMRQPLAVGADTTSEISLCAGGQAANVAAWVAALGASARWLGKRADDDGGRLAARQLADRGVGLVGPVAPVGNGIVVSLVGPDGERSMCPDRGVATELRATDLDPGWLAGCDWLHVSGYALLRDPVAEAAAAAIPLARSAGASISIDLSSWSAIRDRPPARFRTELEALEPDVVFANGDEERILGGPLPGTRWILKRGADGVVFEGIAWAAMDVDRVVDSTGAGDALAAGWLVGGPALALEAAARCVQAPGAMPPVPRRPNSTHCPCADECNLKGLTAFRRHVTAMTIHTIRPSIQTEGPRISRTSTTRAPRLRANRSS